MKIEEVLYLPVKREGFSISTGEDCKSHYRTLDGEEVSSSFKAKSKEELLDQPKPAVPQFVADWYEENRNNLEEEIWYMCWLIRESGPETDFEYWISETDNSIQTLINMHQFGYKVEKEKLYTVEIPNPNGNLFHRFVLCKDVDNIVFINCISNPSWNKQPEFQLTEQQIRKDFDWAWRWKKDVTE